MNALNTLKLMSFDSAAVAVDPASRRRAKLAAKIAQQIAAAKAAIEGNAVNGTEGRRRVRQWFHAVDEKRWALMLFYGSKQLELAKGKNAVECAGLTGVVGTLELLHTAVLQGALDAQITSAADQLKRAFKPKQ